MTLLAIDRETFGYADHAILSDVSLSIKKGDRIALLGRSGAGKSTLIDVLYRRLAGKGAAVALAPQENALVPTLSVFHNVYMGRLDRHSSLYNLANLLRPWPSEYSAVRDVALLLGLADAIDQSVDTLSGGQKQRTAVARALFRGGNILLADEPVSAVDFAQGSAILDKFGKAFETIVVALHDVDLAMNFATRVIGLKDGRVTLDASVASLEPAQVDDLYRN